MNSLEDKAGTLLSPERAVRSKDKGVWWAAGLLMLFAHSVFASDVCSVPDTKSPLDIACALHDVDDEESAEQYDKALQLIRLQLAKPLNWPGSPNPMSESQIAAADKFASLKFYAENKKDVVKFYINQRDLYVVGYQVNGTYYALKDHAGPALKPKVTLSFGGSYKDLESSDVDRKKISYGWAVLSSSVTKLAVDPTGGKDGKIAKKALLVVIPMFMEGARFKYSIGQDIKQNIAIGGYKNPLQSYNIDLMESWSKLSTLAFTTQAGGSAASVMVDNTKTFKNYQDVSGSLAILLTQKK
ncbi:ribosome-inactivating family protein [Pseudomonas protegens]|uniref:ribosome-inactivating family protein n=1 Tax=Pseudomonas protegens TaxID=380021 RepID=UPI001C8E9AD5|nr:ribosome-inactivating family protein [Pseudomonas protegens]QZI70665.1 ribosome-inactivating family protein [Pseudomonas protegens]